MLLLLSVLLISFRGSKSSSVGGGLSISPVEHLEASVAASSAHGSVAAIKSVQDEQECVILVIFSPSKTIALQKVEQKLPSQRRFGLKVSQEANTHQPRWTQLGESSVCAMTGFASDIQHLTGVTLNQVESHQSLYSHAMSVDRIVRALAACVQRPARSKARPYGIQALIVGLDAQRKFQLYTVDPAGGWQHYGGGATAVGRGAEEVRAQLYKALKDRLATKDKDTKQALKMAISSLVGKSLDEDAISNDYSSKLEALLLWKSEEGCCVSRIDDSEVMRCLKRMRRKE